ncbi:uncharacterized protein UPF0233 [Nonomuraea fuscirosea]|uniref:Uncharacterized protein UPF0233 n=1 Tax=Nonomuraea fuscirosea TaxID=1291556 RepID=A0A2T0N9D6_9ACTN|nr:cell division protein CrgA [Nonomuraea fuscirosea]PRX69421.1 uncharacterized protein UPF0233 [Nonomuraea fuscirosea]
MSASSPGSPDSPGRSSRRPARTPMWPVVAMGLCWVVGVLWIVVFYLNPALPVLAELGNYNLLVGFAFIILGVFFALVQAVVAIVVARRRG